MKSSLYYILDPMCSWCWGFRPVFQALLKQLPDHIDVQYVMGGLAPDSDQPMPEETRNYVKQQWQLVSEKTSAEFNWDFWTLCQPRRSTYPACRAVISAGQQGNKNTPAMIHAIQKAYYLQARNPSDQEVLIMLAEEIDLNVKQFEQDIISTETEHLLQMDFQTRYRLGVRNFPTVLLETQDMSHILAQGYETQEKLLDRLNKACSH